jgi:hypothetical protein
MMPEDFDKDNDSIKMVAKYTTKKKPKQSKLS